MILKGMVSQSDEHAMSLRCLAVRLSRIGVALDRMATVPAKRGRGGRHKGDGEIDDKETLAEMAALPAMSANARATKVVDNPGSTIKGNSREGTIYRLGRKYREFVSKPI